MSDPGPYSRVYWSVLDDEKFKDIRADMRHFGSWTLMLVVADMAYPAPAFIPPHVPRASVNALADAELIDLLPARMFRLRGLKKERERRSDQGRPGAAARWGRNTNGVPPDSGGNPTVMPDETRRDEKRKDEQRGYAGTQERPASALDPRRLRGMHNRRLELYRMTGVWPEEEWGPKPAGLTVVQ